MCRFSVYSAKIKEGKKSVEIQRIHFKVSLFNCRIMSFEEKILLKKQIKEKLERLKKELTCQVCMGLFKDPQTMPCAHSYCKQCINDLWRNSKQREGGKFKCPQCRTLTTLRSISTIHSKNNPKI